MQETKFDLTYCSKCCAPDTSEKIKFNKKGVCRGCQASEEKKHIDWTAKEIELRDILNRHKNRSNYDCIVPISGGKDSAFQLHVIKKVYGLKPLAVTFSHNWYSKIGIYNLKNILEKLNIDHIQFTPNRELVNKLARKSLEKIGDPCWACHAGIGAFPLNIAVKFNIPLIIWGESIAEQSGKAKYSDVVKFDREYFTKVSAKLYPNEMTDENISMKDLFPFELPSVDEFEKANIEGIHLGSYINWDTEKQVEFIKKEYDWKESDIEMDGTYKRYKSVECEFHGMHDYTKYLKRGFGRATDHACQDIREGKMSRRQGFELIKEYDSRVPKNYYKFLDMVGLSSNEFHKIMQHHKDLVISSSRRQKCNSKK